MRVIHREPICKELTRLMAAEIFLTHGRWLWKCSIKPMASAPRDWCRPISQSVRWADYNENGSLRDSRNFSAGNNLFSAGNTFPPVHTWPRTSVGLPEFLEKRRSTWFV